MLFHGLRCLWRKRKRPHERRHWHADLGALAESALVWGCATRGQASAKQPWSTRSWGWAGGLEERVPGGRESRKHRWGVPQPGSRALVSSEAFKGVKPPCVSSSSSISQGRKRGICGWTTWLNEMNRSENEMFVE